MNKKISCCWEGPDRTTLSAGNSPAAWWQWLFQTCIFRRLARSQYGFNLFARWHQRLWFKRCGVWGDMVGV